MVRGLATGAVSLTFLAVALVVPLTVPQIQYLDLLGAGVTMLWFVAPFAALVVATLLGNAILPRRPAIFLILLGLDPLTLLRPYLTVAAALTAAVRAPNVAVGAVLAAVAVLAVEPWVHCRWYAELIEA